MAIASAYVLAATRSIKKALVNAADAAEGWAVSRDVFGEIAGHYARRMEDRYSQMQILGMTEPVPLDQVYVRVNVLRKIQERLHGGLEALEKQYNREKRIFATKLEAQDGLAVAAEKPRLMVLGKPGAGKTTFLKHLVKQAFEGEIPDSPIPFFVSLKAWSDSRLPLVNYLTHQMEICNLPAEDAKRFVEWHLKQGRCLLLFDGLDEITYKKDLAISAIHDFVDTYDSNRFVISCRIAAYNHYFARFTDIEMADFGEAQIERFVANWFMNEPTVGLDCLCDLKADKQTYELAQSPLLLALLCLTYDENLDFPPNRAQLYEVATEALLVKWDTSRRIRRRDSEGVSRFLTRKRRIKLLCKMAYATFSNGQYFVRQRRFEELIGAYVHDLTGDADNTTLPTSETILREMEAAHGLIVKRAVEIYSFSHLTIQEYFTARYIVDYRDEGTLERLVAQRLFDSRWREVFLLVAGLLPDVTPLVIPMRLSLSRFIRQRYSDHLQQIEALREKTGVLGISRYGARLIVGSLLGANFLAHAHNLDKNLHRGLANILNCDLSRARDLSRAHDRDSALRMILSFTLHRSTANEFIPDRYDYTRAHSLAHDLADILGLASPFSLDGYSVDPLVFVGMPMNSGGLYKEGTHRLYECLSLDFDMNRENRQALLDSLLLEPWDVSMLPVQDRLVD